VNRGLPPDLKEESKSLKSGDTTFRRKGDILLQFWRDIRVVNMISTIHNSSMVVNRVALKTEMNVYNDKSNLTLTQNTKMYVV
jgi:hypothetical protein